MHMQLQNEVDETGKRAAEMEERITSLTHDNEELQQANDTLTRNISVLFNTAKLEIQRKDDQIKELRQELMRIKRK
jgi:CHASE3 domain sensor protein